MFEKMMTESTHIALVVDKFGGTEGVVTMEDFIETLLGLEIVDEIDTAEDMQEIARKKWKVRAKRSGLITDSLASVQVQAVPEDGSDSSVSEV